MIKKLVKYHLYMFIFILLIFIFILSSFSKGKINNNTIDETNKPLITSEYLGNPFNSDMIITSGFGYRKLGFHSQNHFGLDLVPTKNDEKVYLYAISDCEVINSYFGDSEGNCVIMSFNDEYIVYYLHLSERLVKKGDKLKKGDVVGIMGNSGFSFGKHLHFEVAKGRVPFRNQVNPIFLLDKTKIVNYSEYYK